MDLTPYLEPNPTVDWQHPDLLAWARDHASAESSPRAIAVSLFYAVRDGLRYNPYWVSSRAADYRASAVALRSWRRGGHCIDKAILLAACARAFQIPARLHFATVKNHLSTERLERELGTDLLVFHGYCELLLEGRWLALTPAFNKELCEHLNVTPLEFDGTADAIFQQHDPKGGRFMEYLHDYGSFPDLPLALMLAEWRRHYREFLERVKRGDPLLKEFHWEIDPGADDAP